MTQRHKDIFAYAAVTVLIVTALLVCKYGGENDELFDVRELPNPEFPLGMPWER
jgi:hypothetical protein